MCYTSPYRIYRIVKKECAWRKILQDYGHYNTSKSIPNDVERHSNSRTAQRRTWGSLIPAAGQRPFTLRSTLAIATGRASESLMRPAVERHHRSSRALTQDAPTLRDLLIFEIACPGMFIWRRGCRRESSSCPRPADPPRPSRFLSSNLPADISQLLPSRAPREAPFFTTYICIPRTLALPSPFYRRRGDDDGFRRRLKCQLRKMR